MKNLRISTNWCLALGLAATWMVGCSGASDSGGTGGSGSGGSTATGGTSSSGGTTASGGQTSSGGSTSSGGVTSTGGASSGGASSTGGASSGGASSTGGTSSGGATSTGGSSSGGSTGSGGSDSTGGKGATGGKGGAGGKVSSGGTSGGGTTGTGGTTTGSGGSGAGGRAAGDPEFGSGPERSLGYLGCSMSMNVASGYTTLGGKRLWPSIGAYGAQVVQNWKVEGGPWSGFDGAVKQYGQPTAVWIMLCIFSNNVTLDEAKQIIALTKKHAPDAKLYITGQPLNTGTDCSLAGQGGAAKTDSIAKMAAADTSLGVTYAGIFGPLAVNERMADTCHANAAGEKVLGQQVIDKWGK